MSIFENMPSCIWFEATDKRNAFVSIIAGFLFFLGWWIIIDAASVYSGSIDAAHHICGIFGTISLFMVNAISQTQLSLGDAYSGGCMGSRGVKIWLFIGFVLGFVSVFASIWIMIDDFAINDTANKWPGVGLLLQNILILVSSLIYKFGRREDARW